MFTRCQEHKKLQNNANKLQCQPASVPEGYLLHHCCQQIHIVDPEKKFRKLRVRVRGRQTDEQTDTQTDKLTGTQAGRDTDRQTGTQAQRQAGKHANKQTGTQTDRYTNRQTDSLCTA